MKRQRDLTGWSEESPSHFCDLQQRLLTANRKKSVLERGIFKQTGIDERQLLTAVDITSLLTFVDETPAAQVPDHRPEPPAPSPSVCPPVVAAKPKSTLAKLLTKAKQPGPPRPLPDALAVPKEAFQRPAVSHATLPSKPLVAKEPQQQEGTASDGPTQQPTYEEFMKTQRRAPRRGEIGISADEVQKIESLGYVMSGSTNALAQKRIEAQQRLVHEKQADKQALEFLAETDRRADSDLLGELLGML